MHHCRTLALHSRAHLHSHCNILCNQTACSRQRVRTPPSKPSRRPQVFTEKQRNVSNASNRRVRPPKRQKRLDPSRSSATGWQTAEILATPPTTSPGIFRHARRPRTPHPTTTLTRDMALRKCSASSATRKATSAVTARRHFHPTEALPAPDLGRSPDLGYNSLNISPVPGVPATPAV